MPRRRQPPAEMTSLVRFSQVQVLKHFAGNLNLGCVLGLSALLFSGLGKLVLIPGSSSRVFYQRRRPRLTANFRTLFSSSEEPNTASMAACLALIFEFIQKSVDHSVGSGRRYVTSTGCS
jgi:hypothetical protein